MGSPVDSYAFGLFCEIILLLDLSSEIPSFRVIPIGAGLTEPSAFRVVTMVSTVLPALKPSFSRSPDILVDDMERIYPGDS